MALGGGVRVGAAVLVAVGLGFVAVGAAFVAVMTVFAAVGASGVAVDAGAQAVTTKKMRQMDANFMKFPDRTLLVKHPLPSVRRTFSPTVRYPNKACPHHIQHLPQTPTPHRSCTRNKIAQGSILSTSTA